MVRLNLGFRSDMAWWAVFLESWNGTSMIEHRSSDKGGVVQIWTDASGVGGVVCGPLVKKSGFRWDGRSCRREVEKELTEKASPCKSCYRSC